MPTTDEILLGRIIERSGLATSAQVAECVELQHERPDQALGALLVEKGYLTQHQLDDVLAIQDRKLEGPHPDTKKRLRESLFGQLVLMKNYARAGDVHECLRLQQKLKEHGEHLLLGELLVMKSRLSASQVASLLKEQNSTLLFCESCLRRYEVAEGADDADRRCEHCGAPLAEPTPARLAEAEG